MRIADLLQATSTDLNAVASNKEEAIKKAVALMCRSGAIDDPKTYEEGVFAREKQMTTGIGEGIAIPHCKSKAVRHPALAAMLFKEGVDYESLDGEKVKLLFLIAAPDTEDNVHLDVLARLSNILMHPEYVVALTKVRSYETFISILDYAEEMVMLAHKKEEEEKAKTKEWPKILAVTACPTGIAHTYMAQESLEKCAKEKGLSIKVETNGSGGVKNQLTDEEIAYAEGIIIAADVTVEMERFNGKRLIQVPVTRAITKPLELIDMVLDPITSVYGSGRKPTKQDIKQKGTKGQVIYRHLMSGISHMIPFVIAGGISLAIAYLIDSIAGFSGTTGFGNTTIGAKIFHFIGADFGLGLMFPVLGGFIAYSIAGKPGLVSGFIGAFAAKQGQYSLLYFVLLGVNPDDPLVNTLAQSSSGFLGALVAGFIAGYVVLLLKKLTQRIPHSLAGVNDMLFIPLLSTLMVGAAMLIVNVPLAYINIGIATGLTELTKFKELTLLLGAMAAGLMAIDMGGPINKATHYVIVGLVTTAIAKELPVDDPQYILAVQLNAANLLGMLTPPAGIALATWLFPQKFTKPDRLPSIANLVTGCCGITEGAIPYVIKNPVSTITSTVVGAACGGMISVALGFTALAPEGGLIAMSISGATAWKGFLACACGALITALLLGVFRNDVGKDEAGLKRWKGIPTQWMTNGINKVTMPINNGFKQLGKKIAKGIKGKKKEKK